jgi:phospholipase/carboxylesterase
MKKLDYLEINPKNTAKATVIWLHGLGAGADDFLSIVPQLKLPESLAVRFVFPQAPILPITINNGYEMPAWYDIYGFDRTSQQDEQGIRNSEELLAQLINNEINHGIPSDRIVLAGFSQGGAIALHTALRCKQTLAGVMVLSSYLPIAEFIAEEKSVENANLPIFVAHGSDDAVLPLTMAQLTREYLQAHDYPIDWHIYPMAHQVCLEEIRDISAWLQKILA